MLADAVFAIDGMPQGDLELLRAAAALDAQGRALCIQSPRRCPLQRVATAEWRVALSRAVAHAVSIKGWRAGVVARFELGELLGTRDPRVERLLRALVTESARLRQAPESDCGQLFEARAFGWNRIRACLEKQVDAATFDALQDRYDPLLIETRPGEGVWLASSGAFPEVFEVTTEIRERSGKFITLVHRDSSVTIRAEAPDGQGPALVRSVASDAGLIDLEGRRAKVCFSVDVLPRKDPARRVFVDGREVPAASVVEIDDRRDDRDAEPPNVTIIEVRGEKVTRLASSNLSWEELKPNGCQSVPFDLRPPTAVALVRVEVSKPCFELGVDPGDVQARVETLVSETGFEVRAVQRWADTMQLFASQLSRLSQGQDESQTRRGNLDAGHLSRVGAGEFVRQGFRSLLTVELGCQPHRQGDSRFSFRVYLLDLLQFLAQSNTTTPDVGHAVRSEIEPVLGQDQLDSGIVAALSRLFGVPYVRLSSAGVIQNLRGYVGETVRVYLPKPPAAADSRSGGYASREVRLWAQRLDGSQEYLCPSDSFLGSPMAKDWWRATQHSSADETERFSIPYGVQAVVPVSWDPSRPGTYLIRVELVQPDGKAAQGETVTFGCTRIVDFSNRYWIDTSYQSGSAFAPGTSGANRAGSFGYGRLLAGMSHGGGAHSTFAVGVAVGYSNAVHTADAPPSWEFEARAPLSNVYGYDGRARLDWTRQSLLLGPTFDIRWRTPACLPLKACPELLRSVDLYFRFMPALDLGVFDSSNVDPSLRRFLSAKDGLDLDVSAYIEAGLWMHLHSAFAMYLMVGASWLGLDDYLLGGRNQDQAQAAINYDSYLTLGGTLGIAWSR